MYKLEEISNLIIKSDTPNLPDNYVAAAVKINAEGIAFHAGFIIGYHEKTYLFHYTGNDVDLNIAPIGTWYFHKNFDFITEDEVSAFYNHCSIIEKDAKPEYGYFYSGSFYDKAGHYFSDKNIPEIMTCVSFCLNVIVGFIESDEFVAFHDWKGSDMNYKVYYSDGTTAQKNEKEYLEYFIKSFSTLVKDVDLTALTSSVRRIYPVEYLAASFIDEIPVRRSEIDKIVPMIEKALVSKRAS